MCVLAQVGGHLPTPLCFFGGLLGLLFF